MRSRDREIKIIVKTREIVRAYIQENTENLRRR